MDFAERVLTIDENLGITKEASQRSAISRAYYGAYCYARDYALENGLNVSEDEINSSQMHRRVKDFYHGSFDHDLIRDYLNKLRAERNVADYEGEFENLDINHAKSCVIYAKEMIIDTINGLQATANDEETVG